jgi:excisionase family DNA binding protein
MSTREGWATPGAYAGSQEVADFMALPVSTVQRWARAGDIPAVKLGGKYGLLRFRKLDVEKWASRQPKASA